MTITVLRSREAILEAAGDTPYTRLMTSPDATGVATGTGVAWRTTGPWSPVTCVLGAGSTLDLLEGPLSGYVHLPAASSRPGLALHEVWELRWLTAPPPAVPSTAVRLTPADHPAVDALLDEAFPTTSTRPSDPHIDAWWGIRDATGRLVACGAERTHNGVGYLSAIAVSPSRRGQGLAAAVTSTMANRLYTRHGAVALGVTVDNTRAIDLYTSLGFTTALLRYDYLVEESGAR